MATLRDNYEALIEGLERSTDKKVDVVEAEVLQLDKDLKKGVSEAKTVANKAVTTAKLEVKNLKESIPTLNDRPINGDRYLDHQIKLKLPPDKNAYIVKDGDATYVPTLITGTELNDYVTNSNDYDFDYYWPTTEKKVSYGTVKNNTIETLPGDLMLLRIDVEVKREKLYGKIEAGRPYYPYHEVKWFTSLNTNWTGIVNYIIPTVEDEEYYYGIRTLIYYKYAEFFTEHFEASGYYSDNYDINDSTPIVVISFSNITDIKLLGYAKCPEDVDPSQTNTIGFTYYENEYFQQSESSYDPKSPVNEDNIYHEDVYFTYTDIYDNLKSTYIDRYVYNNDLFPNGGILIGMTNEAYNYEAGYIQTTSYSTNYQYTPYRISLRLYSSLDCALMNSNDDAAFQITTWKKLAIGQKINATTYRTSNNFIVLKTELNPVDQTIYNNKILGMVTSSPKEDPTTKKLKDFPIGTAFDIIEGDKKVPYILVDIQENYVNLVRYYSIRYCHMHQRGFSEYSYDVHTGDSYEGSWEETFILENFMNHFDNDFLNNYLVEVLMPGMTNPSKVQTPTSYTGLDSSSDNKNKYKILSYYLESETGDRLDLCVGKSTRYDYLKMTDKAKAEEVSEINKLGLDGPMAWRDKFVERFTKGSGTFSDWDYYYSLVPELNINPNIVISLFNTEGKITINSNLSKGPVDLLYIDGKKFHIKNKEDYRHETVVSLPTGDNIRTDTIYTIEKPIMDKNYKMQYKYVKNSRLHPKTYSDNFTIDYNYYALSEKVKSNNKWIDKYDWREFSRQSHRISDTITAPTTADKYIKFENPTDYFMLISGSNGITTSTPTLSTSKPFYNLSLSFDIDKYFQDIDISGYTDRAEYIRDNYRGNNAWLLASVYDSRPTEHLVACPPKSQVIIKITSLTSSIGYYDVISVRPLYEDGWERVDNLNLTNVIELEATLTSDAYNNKSGKIAELTNMAGRLLQSLLQIYCWSGLGFDSSDKLDIYNNEEFFNPPILSIKLTPNTTNYYDYNAKFFLYPNVMHHLTGWDITYTGFLSEMRFSLKSSGNKKIGGKNVILRLESSGTFNWSIYLVSNSLPLDYAKTITLSTDTYSRSSFTKTLNISELGGGGSIDVLSKLTEAELADTKIKLTIAFSDEAVGYNGGVIYLRCTGCCENTVRHTAVFEGYWGKNLVYTSLSPTVTVDVGGRYVRWENGVLTFDDEIGYTAQT